MSKRVTQNDIELINELYLELHNYSAVSRQTGFAASTVKKYIIPNYISKKDLKKRPCKGIPNKGEYKINWNIELSEEEIEEIKELWEEIAV